MDFNEYAFEYEYKEKMRQLEAFLEAEAMKKNRHKGLSKKRKVFRLFF
ncbi:hypothetical protein RWE15_15235 [Virgibacillus halophilus]|uniref:Uncharacterized protein n=2 Tax=Tigheibacillus halophilus TaxID=361280 RepID=A0ABU5C8I6_9BACI|nr:hypothetical protein [Virgibacillus halophilus]